MVQSMTGFAEATGADERLSWRWEARGVNGRGLDIRLRLPEGCEALDPVLRAAFSRAFSRGNITVGLRIGRVQGAAASRIDPEALDAAVALLAEAEQAAISAGLALQPTTPDRLLALPGVLASGESEDVLTPGRRAALLQDIDTLTAAFTAARADEGRALSAILTAQIDEIETRIAEARETAEARAARSGAALREKVAALLEAGAPADEGRLAQELALLAVRADVTEELDRLTAHVAAARELLAASGPVGRKFDFLAQEFNREANTLCSKSGAPDLTRVGLELKVLIDQMREQVQNVE
ncbi:YicC family protein [Paroceanicella profunda]|uniref:YicC family protein n=1 Tax=Paroceanicella profunda TaxID=2579971 RepID=A0A5B8FQ39_9RHOB|nr:YicC/YloC family endoribonuclease [Paroceanicella profunda]QDL90696.1 YicC family protein [Paroceanicella profunda]